MIKPIPCLLIGHLLRGQHTLAWSWPDQTLAGQELTDRQGQLPTTGGRGQRAALVSECPGRLERPYCKKLVLNGALGKDTGYYRCYYKDVKDIVDRTTAASVYVFVRGESLSYNPTNTHIRLSIVVRTLIHIIQSIATYTRFYLILNVTVKPNFDSGPVNMFSQQWIHTTTQKNLTHLVHLTSLSLNFLQMPVYFFSVV